MFRLLPVQALLVFALLSAGCGPAGPPTVRLALDGPPLFVAAASDARVFSGSMDRGCMAGVGRMAVHDGGAGVFCEGRMDRPATDKGRLYMTLECGNGETIALAMRNLGPDQGMGLGMVNETGERMAFFYHACEGEARRRLEGIKADVAAAREERRRRERDAPRGTFSDP